ncbi:MAG TPA: IS200/IS605 family transposase [Fluviicola sp.]|nr:IS200/IS605 family transposase [Fluviicola sp.]
MANTYTSIRIHFVFAVKFRRNLIHKSWKDELFKYMTGIIHNHQHQVLAINGVEDHVHILVGLNPNQSISELMKEVKASSSKWINDHRKTTTRFSWQEGFGAFSHSSDKIPGVIRYIQKQEEHHSKRTFSDEFQLMLNRFEVNYDERYVFTEPV